MDNERLALIAILPGIEASIAKLEAERDLILGLLGIRAKRKGRPPVVALAVEAVPEKKQKHPNNGRYRKTKCPDCGKYFVGSQGMSAHRRRTHQHEEPAA